MAKTEIEPAHLRLRFSEGLRARIERAAAASGRSMNAEILTRLQASLDADELAGGPHTARFLRLASALIETIEARTGKKWTEDAKTWAAVASMLQHVVQDSNPTAYDDLPAATREEVASARREVDRLWTEMAAIGDDGPIGPILDQLRSLRERLRQIDPIAAGESIGLDVVNEQFRREDGDQPA